MENTQTHRHCKAIAKLMAVAAVMPVAISVATAGDSGYTSGGGGSTSSMARAEIARRAGLVQDADAALYAGRQAYANKDYETAVAEYRKAVNLLPTGPALADRRAEYNAHLGDGVSALAQQYRRVGKYDEARSLLEEATELDPANFNAKKQLAYLDDPIRTNPSLTYEHTQNVDKVRQSLYKGEGFFNLGDYDKAEEEFKKVLRVDKYNIAARRWMERVDSARSEYYRSAYDQTRSHMLAQVDKAWEIAVPAENANIPTLDGLDMNTRSEGVLYLRNKLDNIVIPIVDFENTSVEEAIDFLRIRARELDLTETDPTRKGINFIIRKPKGGSATDAGDGDDLLGSDIGSARIPSLKLRNVPLGVALQYICDLTRLRYKVDDHSVSLLPINSLETDELYSRTFVVPPDFLARVSAGSGGEAVDDDPFAASSGTGGAALAPRRSVKELLSEKGVSFPDGANANYVAGGSQLIVYNTLNNLDVIDQLVQAMRTEGGKQVRIMTKFVEISQENTDELGFDWIVTPFALGGDGYIAGGTTGNGAQRVTGDFTNINGRSIAGNPVQNISTSGLRSGDYAISRNSIDAILNNPNRNAQTNSVAPGIMSLTGVWGSEQVQMIMRGLAQKKGSDVMTAPSVIARSGEKASIEVIREFIYPTEYEPPELPSSVGSSSFDGGLIGGSSSSFPVTPATPTAFETRNTGVTLEIEPTIGPDNYTIDLRFAPDITEFEGFINYGSPIQSPGQDALGNPVSVTITENRIEMPVFSTRKVTTALTIYDGYTVSVGGLVSESVQNVEDKVPIFGDLPLVGRLFQSQAENRIKSNLIVFVTAQIIDATGRPIHGDSGDAAFGDAPALDTVGVLPGK